ncbi:MAG: DUF262 domain-containing protein [Dehalococcoidia bacterium]|nr:DUF262 domain-containing protein [Dehalococcoidia bacterium]
MTNQNVVIGRMDFRIEDLYKLYEQQPSKILFNTEYQRSYIWKTPRKQLLIDSIVRDYDINKVFLRQLKDGSYECLDGQQRLRSIFDFVDGDSKDTFSLGEHSKDLGLEGKNIQDLKNSHPQFYYKLLYYKIDAVVVYQAEEETTSDIFLRLQEGIPLNSAEKLNAMRGIMRKRVVEMSQYPFWQSLGIVNYRFGHRYLCSQIASLELSNLSLPADGFRINDIKFPTMRRNYRFYKDVDLPQKVLDEISETFNFLHKALGAKAQIIKRRGDIIPIYLLASYLLKRYASVKQKRDKVRDFVEQFLIKVYNSNKSPYFEYRYARSKSTESRKSIEEGFRIILGTFLEFAPEFQLKDEKRLFDYGQRLAIYYRDEGNCQQCGKALKFDEGEFHHVKAWHEGGPTTVENGRLLCSQCHAKQPKISERAESSEET